MKVDTPTPQLSRLYTDKPSFTMYTKTTLGTPVEVKEMFPQKTICLYTRFVWETVSNLDIMRYIDVLVDGEFVLEEKDTKLHWRGSTNQRVIDVPATIKKEKIVLHCE